MVYRKEPTVIRRAYLGLDTVKWTFGLAAHTWSGLIHGVGLYMEWAYTQGGFIHEAKIVFA